jgi:hypothetical protein
MTDSADGFVIKSGRWADTPVAAYRDIAAMSDYKPSTNVWGLIINEKNLGNPAYLTVRYNHDRCVTVSMGAAAVPPVWIWAGGRRRQFADCVDLCWW